MSDTMTVRVECQACNGTGDDPLGSADPTGMDGFGHLSYHKYCDECDGEGLTGKRIVLRRSETFMARQELGPTAEVWIEVSDDE